jgi:hypothetical protein
MHGQLLFTSKHFKKTHPVGERLPPRYYIDRRAQPEPGQERSRKLAPKHEDAAPCSVLNPCFQAQPMSPLHEDPPTTGCLTHGKQETREWPFLPQPINLFLLGIEPGTLGVLLGHLNR